MQVVVYSSQGISCTHLVHVQIVNVIASQLLEGCIELLHESANSASEESFGLEGSLSLASVMLCYVFYSKPCPFRV